MAPRVRCQFVRLLCPGAPHDYPQLPSPQQGRRFERVIGLATDITLTGCRVTLVTTWRPQWHQARLGGAHLPMTSRGLKNHSDSPTSTDLGTDFNNSSTFPHQLFNANLSKGVPGLSGIVFDDFLTKYSFHKNTSCKYKFTYVVELSKDHFPLLVENTIVKSFLHHCKTIRKQKRCHDDF